MKIDLIIKNDNGQWVHLDIKNPDITMTKAFTDLEDPSSINAAYTINCSLPFTKHNDETLGALYNLDYINKGTTTFNQKKKYECHLLHNEETIYEGYFTLDSTTIGDNVTESCYNATIYDEMYNIFKKLDYTLSDPSDSFDGVTPKKQNIDTIDTTLTPQLVTESFKNPLSYTDIMSYDNNGNCEYKIKNMSTNQEVCETFGWLPTYRNADNLEYDKVGVFNSNGTDKESGWDDVVQTLDDLYPSLPHNEYPECSQMVWKTYNCKPYIWYGAYLQFIFSEVYRVTGYKVDLNTKFFSPNNPYYSNLIRTLKYPTTNRDAINGGWKTVSTLSNNFQTTRKTVDETTWQPSTKTIEDTVGTSTSAIFNPANLDVNKRYRMKFTAFATILNQMDNSKSWSHVDARINKYCAADTVFRFVIGNNLSPHSSEWDFMHSDTKKKVKSSEPSNVELKRTEQSFGYQGYRQHDSYIALPNTYSNYFYFNGNGELVAALDPNGNIVNSTAYKPDSVAIDINFSLSQSEIQAIKQAGATTLKWAVDFGYNRYMSANYVAEPQFHFDTTSLYLRDINIELQEITEPPVTFTDMLGEDFNLLEAFTQFIKQFNLVCDVDYVNKKIYCFERGEYFKTNRDGRLGWGDRIEDWSKYINIQDSLEHTAAISEYKNILYTYEDRDTPNNLTSREESGKNANTKDLNLNMPCNTEELNYLEGLNNSYVGKVKSNWLYDSIIAKNYAAHSDSLTPYLYIDCDDQGQPLEDVEGQLLFREPSNYTLTDWVSGLNNRTAIVACDTFWEIDNDEYVLPYINNAPSTYNFVSESDELPKISTYKPFDLQADANHVGSIFSSEWCDKSGNNEETPNVNGLYNVWFKDWNDLLYNYPEYELTNYKMTAYFHIPLDVYKQFDFSHLIMIDNTLWIVTSIDEYCYGNETMKATLVQIKGNTNFDIDPMFEDGYLRVTPQYISLPKATIPKNFTYKVFASDFTDVVENIYTTATLPNWISTFQKVSEVSSGNHCKIVTIQYSTNSNYPTTKQPYSGCAQYSITATSESEKVYITNEINNTQGVDNSISVTPIRTVIPNDTNANSISYKVTTNANFSNATTSGSVINNPSFNVTHIMNTNEYYVTMSFHNTTGTYGDTQTVTFSNAAGQSCTAIVVRDYDHQISVIPNENGDDKLFLLDYTTLNDPLYSNYYFTVRANFDYVIDKWNTTMYDNAVGEYCYDEKENRMELYDVTNPNKVMQLSENGTARFQANTVNDFCFRYPRRKKKNNPSYSGFFTIDCTDAHPTGYRKIVNVFASVMNNQQSDPQP